MKYLTLMLLALLVGCNQQDTYHVKVPYCSTHGGVIAYRSGPITPEYMVCQDGTEQVVISAEDAKYKVSTEPSILPTALRSHYSNNPPPP